MSDALSWIRLALGLAGTAVYCLVGVAVGRRRTSKEGAPGIRAFQIWWFGLAVLTLFGPLMSLLDLLPGSEGLFVVRVFLLQLVLLLLMAALAGLLYYLLYVYTGRAWVLWLVAGYALLETSWIFTVVSQAHVVGYGPQCPNAGFCYEHALGSAAATTVLSLSLFLPILLATLGYFLLFFRVEQPVQRRRIGLVAVSLLLWFGSSLVASLAKGSYETQAGQVSYVPLSQWMYWSAVVSPAISLGASLLILWAYNLKQDHAPSPLAAP